MVVVGENILDMTPKHNPVKEKIEKLDCVKINIFLCERSYKEGEKTSLPADWEKYLQTTCL